MGANFSNVMGIAKMETEPIRKSKKNGTITVKLEEPVEWGEDTITEIVLKKPRGRHIKNLGDDAKVRDFIKIAAKVSGISEGVFDEMISSDVMKVTEAVGELL